MSLSSNNPSTPTRIASASTTPPLLLAQANICIKTNRTFRERLAEVEHLQKRCKEAASDKGDVDGWDEGTRRGVESWIDDIEVPWRCLRRAVWDQEKAFKLVLDSLDVILTNHLLIPSIPRDIYPTQPHAAPLFSILPYPAHTDPLDRPIAVLSLRSLRKEPTREGKDKIKAWAWWCAEMTRRCLREVDLIRQKRGDTGGEQRATGCVMVVDFKNAGFKNIDLDIVPHLLAILQTTYPGLFSTIYLTNHSWTHASLWTVVKRLVPKSVLDRVRFLEKGDLEQVMDLKKVPGSLGGQSGWEVVDHPDVALERYSTLGGGKTREVEGEDDVGQLHEGVVLNEASIDQGAPKSSLDTESIMPTLSRRQPSLSVIAPTPVAERSEEEDVSDSEEESDSDLQVDRMRGFELHLSPDRARHTSFSSSSSSTKVAEPGMLVGSGSIHRFSSTSSNSLKTPESPKIPTRVARRPRLSFDAASERSYSASLQEHHSRRLSETRVAAEKIRAKEMLLRELQAGRRGNESDDADEDEGRTDRKQARFTIGPSSRSKSVDESALQAARKEASAKKTGLAISAYDRMKNPMFGYPTMVIPATATPVMTTSPGPVSSSGTTRHSQQSVMYATHREQKIVPLHGRQRKRDLVKTLFLLGILRIVGLRDWFVTLASELGRLFWGLLFLRRWWSSMNVPDNHNRGRFGMYAKGRRDVPLTPTSGLAREVEMTRRASTVRRGGAMVSQDDWIWLFLSLLVVRDGWGKMFANAWDSTRRGLRTAIGRKR